MDKTASGDGHASPDASTSKDLPTGGQSFAPVYAVLSSETCANKNCHASSLGKGGFKISTSDETYKALINVPADSKECEGKGNRVTPGSAAMSILYVKVAGGAQLCGDQMPNAPLGQPKPAPLSATDQALIKTWIDSGAAK
jgi:hypothetical protein